MTSEIPGIRMRQAQSEMYYAYYLISYEEYLPKFKPKLGNVFKETAGDAVKIGREIKEIQLRESQLRIVTQATYKMKGDGTEQEYFYFRGGRASSFRAKTGHIGMNVEFDLKKYLGKGVVFASIPAEVLKKAGQPTIDELQPDVMRIDVVPWKLITILHKYESLRTAENNIPAPIVYVSPAQRRRHEILTSRNIPPIYT